MHLLHISFASALASHIIPIESLDFVRRPYSTVNDTAQETKQYINNTSKGKKEAALNNEILEADFLLPLESSAQEREEKEDIKGTALGMWHLRCLS